jgi:hypothetical protein
MYEPEFSNTPTLEEVVKACKYLNSQIDYERDRCYQIEKQLQSLKNGYDIAKIIGVYFVVFAMYYLGKKAGTKAGLEVE